MKNGRKRKLLWIKSKPAKVVSLVLKKNYKNTKKP